MPELPDLEVTKEMLKPQIQGHTINEVELHNPVLLRRPTIEIFTRILSDSKIGDIQRYGKFLIFLFESSARLFVNPMLAGYFSLQHPSDKIQGKLGFRVILSTPQSSSRLDLRYIDTRSMGKIYLLRKAEPTSLIPTYDDQGPDALDPNLSLNIFQKRIKKFHAMIKHVLLNQRFIAGIGNAYADEILFVARIYPFRKRRTLSAQEIENLYTALQKVLRNAITTIRTRTGDQVPRKIRDFLQVHGKPDESCPNCGTPISSVKSGIRIANFCRKCQL